jgi:hypothetical protein
VVALLAMSNRENRIWWNVQAHTSIKHAVDAELGPSRGRTSQKGLHLSAAILDYFMKSPQERMEVLRKLYDAMARSEMLGGSVYENAKLTWGQPPVSAPTLPAPLPPDAQKQVADAAFDAETQRMKEEEEKRKKASKKRKGA